MDDTKVGKTTDSSLPKQQPSGIQAETIVEEYEPPVEEEDSKPKAKLPTMTLAQVHEEIIGWKAFKLTPAIAMKMASSVQCAPYLSATMKNKITVAARAYKSAFDEYSSTHEAFTRSLEEDKNTEEPPKALEESNENSMTKDELLALLFKERALAAKKDALAAKKDAMVDKERVFYRMHGYESDMSYMLTLLKMIKTTLEEWAALGQSERSQSRSKQGSSAVDERIHIESESKRSEHSGTGNKKVAGEMDFADELRVGRSVLDHSSFIIPRDWEKSELVRRKLQEVVEHWSSWISNSTIVADADKQDTPRMIKNVIKEIRESLKSQKCSPKPKQSYPFAHFLAQEVKCVQPIFAGLLELIGDCCNVCINPDDFSPFKTQVKTNQVIPATTNRLKRIVDVCLDKPGCLRKDMNDMSIKLPFKLKPLFRESQSYSSLRDESFNQVLGHLAKSVKTGVDLWGCGVSTFATGLTGTVAYITICQLHLDILEFKKVSPEFAKLKLSESRKLPLMTLACFNMWIAKCELEQQRAGASEASIAKRRAEIEKLRHELYHDDVEPLDAWGIPIGIRLLWELMLKHQKDLFGPDFQNIIGPREKQEKIGDLLGTGSFGLVFSYGEKDSDMVLKVPLSENCVHLTKEIDVLTYLGRTQGFNDTNSDPLALPVLTQVMNELSVTLGGVTRYLKGMVLSPKGTPILSWIRHPTFGDGSRDIYNSLIDQLEKALQFLHEKNVYHNDVSPKNIIAYAIRDAPFHFCLVDFGLASLPNEDKRGFVGTPLYAHKDIFERYSSTWKSQSMYDLFGLGLTISVLLKAGETCWDMKPFPTTLDSKFRERFDHAVESRYLKAKSIIESSRIVEDRRDKLVEWISKEGLQDESKLKPAGATDSSLQETEYVLAPQPYNIMTRLAMKRKQMDAKATGSGESIPRRRFQFSKPFAFFRETKQTAKPKKRGKHKEGA